VSSLRDLTLENPIRAIREISHDRPAAAGAVGQRPPDERRWTSRGSTTRKACEFAEREGATDPLHDTVLELWGRTLDAVESDDLASVDTEIDWVIKYRLLDDYADPQRPWPRAPPAGPDSTSPTTTSIASGGSSTCSSGAAGPPASSATRGLPAKTWPPPTTRGQAARRLHPGGPGQHRRDFTVDWVHLKLNDQAQRTVLCKDPFLAEDARVDRLIEGIEAAAAPLA
jgi:proteasome accessory factor A